MKRIKFFVPALAILLMISASGFSQDKDILNYFKDFSISTYVDTYYSIDNDKSAGSNPRMFDLLSPYRDQFGLNIAQVSLKYNTDKIRGTFTLHYGDIPDVNWAPVTRAKFVQEANVGFSPVKNLWIDGGYFVTHIGAESFPKFNYFSTFALPSVFEPFLQSGVKVSYEFSDKFTACVHILNGFNLFEDNNKNKSAGVQLVYAPNEKIRFTYNNIIGNEQPDGMPGKMRLLNNFIVNANPTEKFELTAAFDYGMQEHSKLSDLTKSANYYGASIAGRYNFTPKYSVSLRGDYFEDPDGVVSAYAPNSKGVKANSITIGCQYKPVDMAYLRFEYRFLRMDADQKIFQDNSNTRSEATVSLGLEF